MATSPQYRVTLEIGGETYRSQGPDLAAAILRFGEKVQKVTNRAVFRLSFQRKKSELMRRAMWAKRTITNPTYAFHLGENLKLMLK